ncbi:coiled-coil domain-containing protein 22 [Acinetobacter baumannii]
MDDSKELETCQVCQEKSEQCLVCASYVVNGERIYYEKLKDFGATQDHELRFIQRIQKHRTTAFFHKGKLYIPSRQGRSVPLAIGLQWEAWQEQQAKVEELQKRVDSLTQTMEELLEEMKYPTATFEEVIVCGVKVLEQALKGEGHD